MQDEQQVQVLTGRTKLSLKQLYAQAGALRARKRTVFLTLLEKRGETQEVRACLKIQSGWDGTAKMGRRTAQIPHFDAKIGLATALLNHLGEF
jgi:hypothetical protein